MSAWIVSKAHIDVLVQALGNRELIDVSPDEAGQMLWHENHLSIQARYGDEPDTPPYRYTQPIEAWDPTELLMEVHCYTYQTCEHAAWDMPGNVVKGWCDALEASVLAEGADENAPYSTAPWGVPSCGHKDAEHGYRGCPDLEVAS